MTDPIEERVSDLAAIVERDAAADWSVATGAGTRAEQDRRALITLVREMRTGLKYISDNATRFDLSQLIVSTADDLLDRTAPFEETSDDPD